MSVQVRDIYFISGLGADERLFQKLKFPPEYALHQVHWAPLSPKETLLSYCEKLSQQIDTSRPYALVGLSFGGMVATDLTQLLPVKPSATILISSISSRDELPHTFKFLNAIRLNKVVPSHALNKIYPLTDWMFGASSAEEKKLLREIMKDSSPEFLKWAVNEIFHWQHKTRPEHLYHIHGTNDKIFPYKLVKADQFINNAGHFMVYTHAEIVSEFILKHLEQ